MTDRPVAVSSRALPTVSVIVPCYNHGHFIAQTLESLQRQTERSWEAIVVDDDSTDDTAGIVAALAAVDPRIRYVYRPHRGLSAARNFGLGLARGQYMQFLDADDLIEHEKLAHQVAVLAQHRDVGIVYGAARYFDASQPTTLRLNRYCDEPWMPCVSGTHEVLVALLEGNIMVVQAPLTRRQVLEKQGGFDESLPALEDWDLWLRCAIAGTAFLYTEQPGTRSLVRVNTASLSHNNAAMTAGAAKIRNKLAAIAPGSVPLVRAKDDCRRRWHDRVCQAAREISGVLRDRGKLILVDDYVVSGLLQASSDVYPMMEREGGYLGPPVDGDEALQQLDRLRTRGTIRLAFVFNVFWWLDHYHALRTYVLREGRIIHASPVLKVYEFGSSG